jgi:hypothetical protein
MLVVGMIGACTVNLGHTATQVGRSVLIASTYRRLQRFFQYVDLGPNWVVLIIARLDRLVCKSSVRIPGARTRALLGASITRVRNQSVLKR